ncbi:hypothetical protein SM124_09715 [Bacillus sp. 31A1R]|uniref:Uncharacterized protein n=1 Tax=Robertmurraya mangrovi TaxID=3098077 RepID=A0ABU5IXZ8_9BACI|nr:hypothetical protein [Bacillus sp. 31A1R]MDZ5472022.1 hypothetical protein [Bacillus sp. 31A1R]
MKVLINQEEVVLFRGASLKHALLKKNQGLYNLVLTGEATIFDQYGNEVEMNGAAEEGMAYTVQQIK